MVFWVRDETVLTYDIFLTVVTLVIMVIILYGPADAIL